MKAILLIKPNIDKIINEAKTAINPEELHMMIDGYFRNDPVEGWNRVRTPMYFVPWFETAGSGAAYTWGTIPVETLREHFDVVGKESETEFFEIRHKQTS